MANRDVFLTDFIEDYPQSAEGITLTQWVRVLKRLKERKLNTETRSLEKLSKPRFFKIIHDLLLKGLIKRVGAIGEGVYELTEAGEKELNERVIPVSASPEKSRGTLIDWLSAHRLRLRFSSRSVLKPSQLVGLIKGDNGHYYLRDFVRGVNLEVTRRCVFADVSSVRGRDVKQVLTRAFDLARLEVQRFGGERGVRFYERGSWVNAPEWVIEDDDVGKLVAELLDLRLGETKKEFVKLSWWIDGSHKKVEFSGGVKIVSGVVDEFKYLLEGGLRRDLRETRELLRTQRLEQRELFEELRFKPDFSSRRVDVA